MEVAGPTALWNRPDVGDAPSTYPAPTYSAVKAIFESILWGPAVEIIPKKVEICSPIQYHTYTTNYGGPLRSDKSIKTGSGYQLLATVLTDVCYKLYADVQPNPQKKQLPSNAIAWNSKTTSPGHAYQGIFNRRLMRGQSFSVPCFGWREFTASYFGPLRKQTSVLVNLPDIHIPSMLREVFSGGYNSPVSYVYDQNVIIKSGCLSYTERSNKYAQ
jgi:CRISPR-associated protein Cas5d